MNKIEIKLLNKYKSFEGNFSTTLNGDLIILSGINGAGKSQLMNIISGYDKNINQPISSEITSDGYQVFPSEIDHRSFKENIGIPEITHSTSQTFLNSIESAWSQYTRNRLNYNNHELIQNKDSCIEAKNLLLTKYSEDNFNHGYIPEADFKKILKESNFIWKYGDRFTNVIGEIFFLHALEINKKMVEVGRNNFKDEMLPEAPWITLNNLFDKLQFGYRFKENFEIIGVEINEQPKLFAINSNNLINENESRMLSDLSDGEKTIISLTFGALVDNKNQKKKILLLDELDSVLNPTLIEMFFKVLDLFFIQKGIKVIISTHSSATISLAPKQAVFYEIYKPNEKKIRILEISPDEYAELKIANRNFFEKIHNQESRINELQETINSTQEILIITEGKTDWKYFISALRYFHSKEKFKNIQENYFYRFGSKSDVENKVCETKQEIDLSDSKLKTYLNSLVEARKIDPNNKLLRIGIFDSDNSTIQLVNDENKLVFSFKIEPQNISTEFLFSDDEIKTEIDGRRLFIGEEFNNKDKIHITNPLLSLGGDNSNLNKAGKKVIIESDVYNRERLNVAIPKEHFAQAIYNEDIEISDTSWNNFEHIFKRISEIIIKKEANSKITTVTSNSPQINYIQTR